MQVTVFYEKYPTLTNTFILVALRVCRTNTGHRDPVSCQHNTKVSALQNVPVFANSRSFSLSRPTVEEYPYSLQ